MFQNDTIGAISKSIKSGRLAVFCGAGISYNSGLPIVPDLLEYLFSKLGISTIEANLIKESNLPFERIMEMVLAESTLNEIQDIFKEGLPNTNHVFISKLAYSGYLKIICTTNFDLLIEKALEMEGLERGKDFAVYSSETSFSSIPWESSIIKVIKIHGCISEKEEMAITMSLIASERYGACRQTVMKEIFASNKCDAVMVLGYSCSDLDLTSHINSFSTNLAEVLYVDHKPLFAIHQLKKESLSANKKSPFQFYPGSRLIIDTDVLIKILWQTLLLEQYIYIPPAKISWKPKLDEWYEEAEKESGRGVKHHIASRLLYSISAFKEAIEHNRKACVIAMEDRNIIAYSSEMSNMGMAFSAIGDYTQARFCLNESIPLCRRIGNVSNLASQLQALGNVLHRLGDNTDAIKIHKEALQYAGEVNDEECICSSLGNISNAYNGLKMYEEAASCLTKGISLARKLGNLQFESSQLGSASMTYFHTGKYQQSLEYALKSIAIKKNIGDLDGECRMFLNIANVYNILNMQMEANDANSQCIQLAKMTGNKHLETMALVQLASMEL